MPVEDLLVAQLTLTGDPDWLASDEHGIWVQRAIDTDVWVGTAATTVQLDPTTDEVLLEVDAPAEPEGSVALDTDTVWVRNANDFLIRIDPDRS